MSGERCWLAWGWRAKMERADAWFQSFNVKVWGAKDVIAFSYRTLNTLEAQHASLALQLSTAGLSKGSIRLTASTHGLKENSRMQKTKTKCPEKSLNVIKGPRGHYPSRPSSRTPLWLLAPGDSSELSSTLLQHQSPWSHWQVTRLRGTLMPSSPSGAHSSPSAQPERIWALMRWDVSCLLERRDIIQ